MDRRCESLLTTHVLGALLAAVVLIIFIAPSLTVPPTALRAQQAASLIMSMMTMLALLALLSWDAVVGSCCVRRWLLGGVDDVSVPSHRRLSMTHGWLC